jgi:uncharacterized Zn-binding protein involved in type VI secretion
MPNAARKGDPIGHSPATNWLVKGLLVGAAVGVAAVAIAGTGGLAAAAIVGGLAAGGAGVGELLSSMSWAPKEKCGIILIGSENVFINNRPAARAHVDTTICSKHSGTPPISTGSATVIFNNMPAARVDDKISCGAVIVEGSPDVIIGGGTAQTDDISPENLVPGWAHWALLAVGVGAAVVLGGPIVAALGIAGGIGGGLGGGWLGGKIFGEGSDGQKWMMLGGSILGGTVGVKGGMVLANKAIPAPITQTQGFLKGGVPGLKEAAGNRASLLKNVTEGRIDEINTTPKSEFPNGRRPVKTSAAIDKKTGKVYQDDSGYPLPAKEEIHPTLRDRMPNPSLVEKHVPENCAEFKAANKALNDGAKLEDIDIYTINRQKNPIPRCKNCEKTTDGVNAISDKQPN